jgi:hypothetical protein
MKEADSPSKINGLRIVDLTIVGLIDVSDQLPFITMDCELSKIESILVLIKHPGYSLHHS